ncbi:UDP-3-O-(3-hydroxymyristoyl)glucosamine N-acyltransferase [Marinimicrobium agarilyticum]|uniref:UDP-3-O-(3-hydroxymyristoyl)glucosamine N-acyltransferase n=1 Tax=Marinimicrobium agarilyticum TaxID=306546 RepID=UPI00040E5538|nr:UDP-3-O-(3-hydroxymyristoyl)glucosamine N-acyltransferase [Marinimicrobium agarilyticum]
MTATHTLSSLAQYLGIDYDGDPECALVALATLQSAVPGQVSFIANPVYRKYLARTRASAVILAPALAGDFSGNKLLTDKPYEAYARLTALFDQRAPVPRGIHPSALVGGGCQLADDVAVGPNVVIGDDVVLGPGVEVGAGSTIGDGCVLGAGSRLAARVVLYHNVRLGRNCLIHSGAVVGADGFGFAPTSEGWLKIHQLGGVVLGDNVEVGSGTTIDRGALDDTWIGDGVKIDNQVQVAHNVRIGNNTAIAGQVGIAGSTTLGENCTIAGGVGIIGHLTIADGVHVTAMSLVTHSIREAGSYSSGTPLTPTREWRRNAVRFKKLDELAARLKKLDP